MKYLLILISVILFAACNSNKQDDKQFKVQYKGALKNMMNKGDLSGKADLIHFKNEKHPCALGAIENLKGEIQIFNSSPFNTGVKNNELIFDNTFDKKASLFVYASVPNWKSISIPNDIITYKQLEIFIKKFAQENNINTNKSFPFLLVGNPKSFNWYVINWKDGDTEHSHKKHINSGLHGTIKNKEVVMLAFYSDSHHAIFTHHTTNMHIHVKTINNKLAGHVDSLNLSNGHIS